MQVFNQPWQGRMEDELYALLQQSPRFDSLYIAVAFVKRSGVKLLRPALDTFVSNGGSVEVIAGIDHRGTSKQGLEELLQSGVSVSIFHDPLQDQTFHTKLYLFERTGHEAVGFVGSSNLTAGGLYSNYETNVRYNLDLTDPADVMQFQSLIQVFQQAHQHAQLLTSVLLADIEQRGWLGNEASGFTVIPTSAPGANTGTSLPPTPSPFPRIPIPIAPRRPRATAATSRTGSTRRVAPPAPLLPAPIAPPGSTLINYTLRDVSRAGGSSPDFQITKEIRDANPSFWQWNSGFVVNQRGYTERRTDVVINGTGPHNIRLYDNSGPNQSGEFRINSGLIRANSQIGDLLRIDLIAAGTGYEYEFTRIAQVDPNGNLNPVHQQLKALCKPISKNNSTKVYVYI